MVEAWVWGQLRGQGRPEMVEGRGIAPATERGGGGMGIGPKKWVGVLIVAGRGFLSCH